MRPSPQRHVVAVLRLKLGLEQKEFAPLVGCSVETLKSVELGRLKLSGKLAEKIYLATGVDWGWLVRNAVNEPLTDDLGRPYTKEHSYKAALAKSNKLTQIEQANLEATDSFLLASILQSLSAARKTSAAVASVAAYKLAVFQSELGKQFGYDPEVVDGKESRTRYRVFEAFARSLKASERRFEKAKRKAC